MATHLKKWSGMFDTVASGATRDWESVIVKEDSRN